MKNKIKSIAVLVLTALFCANLCAPLRLFASAAAVSQPPAVAAESAIVIEQESGKVLFSKNEHKRMYPASMTKILTAMVVLDYLPLDGLVTVGKEINSVPVDSSKAGHTEGETISVLNLLRALLIMSGNETACTLALATAKQASGEPGMAYASAERYFCDLMNKKAGELGAVNSNFTNPHGYHHENMYTTAYDMALISREAMKIDIIHQISAETVFTGNGAGYQSDTSLVTKNYNWKTHNELLINGDYYYPYATGIKTGRHSNAGDCLAASAVKDGVSLIAVVCNSPDPSRWTDTIAMFEYSFGAYSLETIYEARTAAGEVYVQNPRLQEPETMVYYVDETVKSFVSKPELERVVTDISFLPELMADVADGSYRIKTPVEDGQVIGTAVFSIDGNPLYTGYIIAGRNALQRDFSSDMDYYLNNLSAVLFTKEAVPYWIIGVLLLVILVYIIIRISRRKKSMFYSKRRFY